MAPGDKIEIKGRSAAQRAEDRQYQSTTGRTKFKLTTIGIPPIPVPPSHSPLPSQVVVPREEKDIVKAYEHTPLTDAGSFIRILSLAPDNSPKPLCGEIFTCPISKVVGYEALSYRWGEESRETDLRKAPHIRIGDKYHKITPSLHEALSTLRFSDKARPLWVDQVCINQANRQEKGKQLPLMGQIYRHAQRALIWLGTPNEDDEVVLSIIKSYTPFWQQLEARVGLELRMAKVEQTEVVRAVRIQSLATTDTNELLEMGITSALDNPHISSSQVPKILDFYNKPWFTRTWPVQEVVLSRIRTVRCGQNELEWAYVSQFASLMIHKFPHVKFDAWRLRGLYAANQLHWWAQTFEGGFSLVALLRSIRNYEATEDKDKVYGILNMIDYNLSSANKPFDPSAGKVTAIPTLLSPDYSTGKSALDVYHDVACYIMTREKSLDFLTFAHMTLEKPTWVPRWNVCESYTPLWYPGVPDGLNYSASTSQASGATFSLRPGKGGRLMETCVAFGIKIDEVETLPLYARAHEWSTEALDDSYLARWVNDELVASSSRFSWMKRSPSKELMTALAMTLTAGREHPAPAMVPADRVEIHVQNFLAWVRGLDGLKADECKELIKLQKRLRTEKHWSIGSEGDGDNYGAVARAMCCRRALFRTRGGRLGLGCFRDPAIVVILQGAKVPFTLSRDPDEPGCYKLSGPCYIDGVMKGELETRLAGRLDRFTIV